MHRNRRQVLTSLGAIGSVSIAGCSSLAGDEDSSDESTDNDTPATEDTETATRTDEQSTTDSSPSDSDDEHKDDGSSDSNSNDDNEQEANRFEVEIVSVTPKEPIQNSELSVEYIVTNPNETTHEESITIYMDNKLIRPSETLSLEPNETRTFGFDLFKQDVGYVSPGDYEIRVEANDDTASNTVTIRKAEGVLFETTIEAVAGRVEDPDATVSRFLQDSVVVQAEVTNTGEVWTRQDIFLFVDDQDEPIWESDLTLGPDRSDIFQFSPRPNDTPELVHRKEHTLTVASESELSLEEGSEKSVTIAVTEE